MILRYYGHSFFTLTLENGKVIAFDPYGDFYQYPKRKIPADVCCISHHHHDHNGVSSITSSYQTIDTHGCHRPFPGVSVYGTETSHDDQNGALRGKNIIFTVEAEGLSITHCGDLGHTLSTADINEIGQPDILLVPVGGYYTIDSHLAAKVQAQLSPIVTIPMHYKTEYDPEMPIEGITGFLSLTNAQDTQCPLLRLTHQDISERPTVMTMKII